MFLRFFGLMTLLVVALHGADWLMLQGSEGSASKRFRPWGFVQLRYEHNFGKPLVADGIDKTPFVYNRPELQDQEGINVARFRLGLRGALDDENLINYFFLSELGNNGITNPAGHSEDIHITDLSVTLKHLPLFIRVGQFKYPGSEEGLQARYVSPFIEFTTVTNQLMMERFIRGGHVASDRYTDLPASGVGAFRDSGIELFNTFVLAPQDRFSLAYMLGEGSGLERSVRDSAGWTHYGYAAYEHLWGKGRGYQLESIKIYGWFQQGQRRLDSETSSTLYDRVRYGVGLSYHKDSWRFNAEAMAGYGMIFGGSRDVAKDVAKKEWHYLFHAGSHERAEGAYAALNYEFSPHWEALMRYDYYDRLPNDPLNERVFETVTLGGSYHLGNLMRLDLNYDFNSARAPHNAAAQDVLDHTGEIIRIQWTMIFQ